MLATFACSQIWGKAITRDVLLVITNSFAQETFIFLSFPLFCKPYSDLDFSELFTKLEWRLSIALIKQINSHLGFD